MSTTLPRLFPQMLQSANMPVRRPVLNERLESNVRGLYVVGELAAAPVLKLAIEQGERVAAHIATQPDARGDEVGIWDLAVIGSGAAGLSAALTASELGLRVLLLEKGEIAQNIAEFPEGKRIYAQPGSSRLWLQDCTKEELVERWREQTAGSRVEIRTGTIVDGVRRKRDRFEVATTAGTFLARRVVVATGQGGSPRRLNVPGEDNGRVHHRLHSPRDFQGESILVVGGGNSAVEAALALSENNQVTLSYRGGEIFRVFRENRLQLEQALAQGRIKLVLESEVLRFTETECVLRIRDTERTIPYDRAFVLAGTDPPERFLRSLGLRLENDWTPSRYAWLAFVFALVYSIFAMKQPAGHELWPFRGWGADLLAFSGRPWGFWFTMLYTVLLTGFGIKAMKRWGFDRKDRFQIWRYTSLIGFQIVFFCLIPEFLFRTLASTPVLQDSQLAAEPWRSYGIVYAWPLAFYTFFGSPHDIWVVWGLLLSFVLLPVMALYHGKRYCSWICGCGGLAETVGDRWRHLAPKGRTSIRWERMNSVVLVLAVAVTLAVVSADLFQFLRRPANFALHWYHMVVEVWLSAIIPIALYPFLGGKIWCRYWCPLAKMIELFSTVFTRKGVSRFAIHSNENCIACGECTRQCQVGIDVMRYALKQEKLTNLNSSCIGCGICVTVCPMNVLSFKPHQTPELVQIQAAVR